MTRLSMSPSSSTNTTTATRSNFSRMLRSSFLAASFVMVLGFMLGGCGADFKLSGIQVTIVEVKQVTATTLETQLTLVLRYTNENLIPIGASNSVHKLYLNGTFIGKSVSDKPIGMPQVGTTTQETTFHIENIALLNQLKNIADNKTASYKLESRIRVQSGEDANEYKTTSEGAIDLRPLLGK